MDIALINDIKQSNTLDDNEKDVLVNLVKNAKITDEQVAQALSINERNKTPLLHILGAMNYVKPAEYAENFAEVSQNAYISPLIETDFVAYDTEFIRQYDPAVMSRYLFCPLQRSGDMVTVLIADSNDEDVTPLVHEFAPNTEIMPLIGTEADVQWMLSKIFDEELSHNAVHELQEDNPAQSASRVFTSAQLLTIALIAALLVLGLVLNFWVTLRSLVVLFSILYVIGIGFRFALTLSGLFNRNRRVTLKDAKKLTEEELPVYSILVPVYKEPTVIPILLQALANLDYPHEKLDVLLLLEEDDVETLAAARAADPPSYFRFIIVPDSQPRTKPKACNYGLNFCRGDFVTIYDAEDIPEPDQLRKAVAAFRKGDESLICVQSALNYYNANENYLTRMFTLEYTYWFDFMLPGLDRMKMPIPLGGTSNHFRLDILRKLGNWDPYNVTEDADLGIRAAANGYTVGVINSTTYEEANKAYKNWIRQRSRWIKGYMQTWLVHNRNPFKLFIMIGLKAWFSYQMFIGGTVWIFLINPLMWSFFIVWLLFRPAWMGQLFYGWVWDLAFFSLIVGNGLAILMNMIAAIARKKYVLALFSITNPLYWTLHSIAAYVGLWQLIRNPFYWEKTNHGLSTTNIDHLLKTPAKNT